MAGTIICDYIRTDANQLSLNVGNTTFATINASGFFSNTGTQLIAANGKISGASVIASSIPGTAFATAAIPSSKIGTGAVVQVVTGSMSGSGTSTSSSYVDDGSLSITPLLSSSLIVVICQTACSTSGDWSFFKIVESVGNTTVVLDVPCGNFSASPQQLQGLNLTGYYTNASTSSKTFKLQGRNNTGGAGRTRYINYMTGSNMILMEIAV